MVSSSDSFSVSKSLLRQIGLAIVSLVVLGAVLIALVGIVQHLGKSSDSLVGSIQPSEYQAVFLTNSQVYFGRLSVSGEYYRLTDVYYLSQQASPQSGKVPQQTLVKLGNEIHGPEDLMVINRAQVLFVENLKPTGKVSQAIKAAQSSGH